ncbi:MAG: pyruvate kinase [Planctomycetes bacterium]|nr:pyruvate kinase [Planctomycetota bacterium]
MRLATIVATVGPASDSELTLTQLVRAGVDVFRLNFSHGTHADHAWCIWRIRRVARRLSRAVAILADLQGPKMRVGKMRDGGPVTLVRGQSLVLTTRTVVGDGSRLSVTYRRLPLDVQKGDTILLDDGLMELRVLAVSGREVRCKVVVGGLLKERKGINLPGVALSAPAMTAKDVEDLRFAVAHGVDYVALSFARRREDVLALRRKLRALGAELPIIAKIERPEGVANLDGILDVADGVMVARGDLGVEASPPEVPILQKQIIQKANEREKLVITATQMLESMITNPRPTRAEATDVANAILDGTDAVMLSGETAIGQYPVEAVRMMAAIAERAEATGLMARPSHAGTQSLSTSHAVAEAACAAAADCAARAVLVFTLSGATARMLAKLRPSARIIALTPNRGVFNQMAMLWGVTPALTAFGQNTEQMIAHGEAAILRRGLLKRGDTVVVLAGATGLRGATNMMNVHRLGL